MLPCGIMGNHGKEYVERWYNYGNQVWRCTYTIPHNAEERKRREGEVLPEERAKQNIRRSVRTVEEIAICNPWKWWVTFTFDGAKVDRFDIASLKKIIAQWLRDERKKNPNLKYLIVPEQHKRGGWHMHGLLMGLPEEALRSDWKVEFKTLPRYIREGVAKGSDIRWWPKALKKFGYNTIEPVRSRIGCARYMAKYMSKAMEGNAIQEGKALFIASQGLERAKEIKMEELPEDVIITSGYRWETGAAYWLERFRPGIKMGELVDTSVRTVQIP